MSRKLDLTGQRYGMLTVIKEVEPYISPNGQKNIQWLCQCDCGNTKIVKTRDLRRGHTKSCGCMSGCIDHTGERFGRLVAIKHIGQNYLCKCDCGNETLVFTNNLTSGATQSCGCLQKEKTSEALSLKDMIGKRFGRLLAIEQLPSKNHRTYYKCQCDCGNIIEIPGSYLTKTNGTKSCGCLQKEAFSLVREKAHQATIIDLTGQKFGRLTVKRLATDEERKQYNKKAKMAYWWCDCDCGTKNVLVGSYYLTHGESKSCGCLRSYGEELIGQILKNNNIQFQREYSFNDLCGDKAPLRFDFAIFDDNKFTHLIECDGAFHRINAFNKEQLDQQQRYDQLKDDYCRSHSIPLLRIEYNTAADISEEKILNFIGEYNER